MGFPSEVGYSLGFRLFVDMVGTALLHWDRDASILWQSAWPDCRCPNLGVFAVTLAFFQKKPQLLSQFPHAKEQELAGQAAARAGPAG
jgi:hypothetical protein